MNMPRWMPGAGIGAVIVVLACIEPVLHGLMAAAPPPGMAHSGLHTVDTYAYLSAMTHCHNAFYSPYAACHDPDGPRHPSLYALPHHRMYGALGTAARALHAPPFLFLGLVNGLGLAFLLVGAFVLLRVTAPPQANLAFFLFALGGGLGGVVYVLTGLFGLHGDPHFPEWFGRFFFYELNEGARFYPHLLMARLYYTLPLGLGFLALAALAHAISGRPRIHGLAALLLAVCAFLNFRVGPMVWGAGVLGIAVLPAFSWKARLRAGGIWTAGAALGVIPAVRMMCSNPALMDSVRVLGGIMWIMPFLFATAFHWVVLPGAVARGVRRLPGTLRVCGGACAGYAAAYAVLYLLYQAYWGNWMSGGEDSAARAVSDPALAGAIAGALAAAVTGADSAASARATEPGEASAMSWFALWFLTILCASIAALGNGWMSQFMPQRCMTALGLPMAALCAHGLQDLWQRRPLWAAGTASAILACGGVSIAVTWGVVHGPWGADSMQKHYPWTNYLFITEADALLLRHIDGGVTLAPSLGDPLFGDVAVVNNPAVRAVYGNGTMDFSHEIMADVRARVASFFAPESLEAHRRAFVRAWCVDYVYCPDDPPVAPGTIAGLRRTDWLREICSAGRGALFKVMP